MTAPESSFAPETSYIGPNSYDLASAAALKRLRLDHPPDSERYANLSPLLPKVPAGHHETQDKMQLFSQVQAALRAAVASIDRDAWMLQRSESEYSAGDAVDLGMLLPVSVQGLTIKEPSNNGTR